MKRVIVVGAGIAGLAATWSAARRGYAVTLVDKGVGASALTSGAVDDRPWEQLVRAARVLGLEPRPSAISPDVLDFVRALDLWNLPEHTLPWLATAAGRIRPARGYDRALLNLAPLVGTTVLIPRVERAGWDASALAAALSAEPFARARALEFVAVELPVLRFEDEHRIADGDLARRHDDPVRLEWLAARLCEKIRGSGGAGAVLLGPWLGTRASQADILSHAAGVPIGEALVGVGSPAGLRFEAARARLIATLGTLWIKDRAVRIAANEGAFDVSLERRRDALVADSVILTVGGVAGGGILYAPSEYGEFVDVPARVRAPFSLSLDAPVPMNIEGGRGTSSMQPAANTIPSSIHGPELAHSAWPEAERSSVLESVGVRCDGVRAAPGIHAAGDVVAGRSRTLLEAVVSGLAAGAEA